MNIALITDLHIGEADEKPHDVNVRHNLQIVLKELTYRRPDYLIVCGDLCFKGSTPEIYRWVKSELDKTGIPYSVLAGNHDQSSMLARSFDVEPLLKNRWLYYRNDMGKIPVLCLDTSAGIIEAEQLKWISKQLRGSRPYTVIFMHHPLLSTNVPFMEFNHGLRNTKKLIKLLVKHKKPVHLFCGHYHIERSVQFKNISQHITPSCFYQIMPDQEEFEVDHYNIAFRWIQTESDRLIHAVEYFPPDDLV